uniref:Protein transport protein Sec31A n=1 Tax=Chrysolophus pictus TaxID=9089 RepID=A0A8C3LNH0_CHRPC
MKLKEIERTAVEAWSPANNHPIYLATGTSAQQLDASFSTNATLEIFEVDFRDPSLDMKQKGTLPASNRFHKLIWGNFGNGSPESSGVIIGGGENGVLTMYSAHRILASKSDPVIGQTEKHSGPVRALDFNPFQSNLLASGANDSEIFIWDLNNFSVPMTPGTKSQPHEDISVVSWNRQVQHILSSAHPSGKAVVWDLRKNEPIIKVSDHSNRMHCSGMAWHPEVATQLVLSSEDDRLPVIQIWDLRFATSPLSQLEGHTRGVLSVSWCQADPELLLSSAKDNRILCWNPSTGEVVYELPIRSQWCFDVQWCPRNPSVFSAATFDGWINIYSVMGGNLEAQQRTQADKVKGQTLPPLQVPEQVAQTTLIPPLKKPPKWIRRPVGVSFANPSLLIAIWQSVKGNGKARHYIHNRQCSEAVYVLDFFISSIVQQKWQDIVCTCDLQSWKEALAILLTYSKHEDYTQLCDMLGSRLELEGDAALSNDACLCYISSGNVERLVECWVKNHETSSPLALQDLIEKVMVLSRSIEMLRGTAEPAPGPVLAEQITQYASLLASQGCLAAAMNYLPNSSKELLIEQLRDRLYHAQGENVGDQPPPPFPFARVNVGVMKHTSPAAQRDSTPEGAAHRTNRRHPEKVSLKLKCLHRTSDADALSFLFIALSQSPPFSPVGVRPGGPAPFPNQPPLSGQSMPMTSPGVLPSGPALLTPASIPSSQLLAARPLPVASQSPLGFSSAPFSSPMNVGYPQGGPGAPSTRPLPAASLPPPPIGKCCLCDLCVQDLPEKFAPLAPITAPVMSLPTEPQGIHPQLSRLQESGQSPPGAPKESSLQYHQLPAERVEKKEVPPEHQGLKTTLEGLVQRCSAVATDPKTRRKLEDALQRLETLYDKLREQALSPAILMGLHEIARCIEARNYQQGLMVHTQVVSSSSFSEVSGFMPVLKVLMTIAGKLNV